MLSARIIWLAVCSVAVALCAGLFVLGARYEEAKFKSSQASSIAQDAQVKIGAVHERAVKESVICIDGAATRDELARMRIELNKYKRTPTACAAVDDSAGAELFESMARDIEKLGEQGARIAEAADGHAADALMLSKQCGFVE